MVNEWLAASGATEMVLGAPGWSDPPGPRRSCPARTRPASCRRLLAPSEPTPGGWLDGWQAASTAAAKALADELDALGGRTEPGVARAVVAALPDGARLVVSSSMPIRDVERYAAPGPAWS